MGSLLARRRSCGKGGSGGTGGASIDIRPSIEGENAGSLPRLEDRRESEVTDVGTEASRDGGRPPQYPIAESRDIGRVDAESREPGRADADELEILRCRGELAKLDMAADDGVLNPPAFGLDIMGLDATGLVATPAPRTDALSAVAAAAAAGMGMALGGALSVSGLSAFAACARGPFPPWYICREGSTGALGVMGVIGVVGVGGTGGGDGWACETIAGKVVAAGMEGDVGWECDCGAGVVFSIPLEGGGEAERLRGRSRMGASTLADGF